MRKIEVPEMTPGYMIFGYSKYNMEAEIKADIEALQKAADFGGQVKDPSDPLLEVKEKLLKMMSDAHQRCDRWHIKRDAERRKKFVGKIAPIMGIGAIVMLIGFFTRAYMWFFLGVLITCSPLFYCKLTERVFYHLTDLDKQFFNGQVHYCWQNGLPLKKN